MGLLFTAYSLTCDMHELGTVVTTWTPFLLLGVAILLIALGFEFVNGFHDTANAVATVICHNSLPPQFAWSGSFNFLGVLLSSGVVAFGIIALLPVEVSILQVGSSAGFAMIFALLDRGDGGTRHLVAGVAGVFIPHPDRLDHRCRRGQRPAARA